MKKILVVVIALFVVVFVGLFLVSGAGGKREKKSTGVEQQAPEPSDVDVPHRANVEQAETVLTHTVAGNSAAGPELGQSDMETARETLRGLLQAYLDIVKTAPAKVRRQRWYELMDFAAKHPDLLIHLAEKGESIELRYGALLCLEFMCKEGHKIEGVSAMVVRLVENEDSLVEPPYLLSSVLEIARLLRVAEVVPAVNRLLSRRDIAGVVDTAALWFIRECGNETSIDPLMLRWENSGDMFALEAATAIGGEKLVEQLVRLILHNPDGGKAAASASWLQRVFGLEDHIEVLKRAILFEQTASVERKHLLISAIGAIQSTEVVEFLLPLARMGRPYVFQVIEALRKNHTGRAFEGLLEIAAGAEDPAIRQSAIYAIGQLPVGLWNWDALYSVYSAAQDDTDKLIVGQVLCLDRSTLANTPSLRSELLSLSVRSINQSESETKLLDGIELLCRLAVADREAARLVLDLSSNVEGRAFTLAGAQIVETLAALGRESAEAKQRFWELLSNPKVEDDAKLEGLRQLDLENPDERRQLASFLSDSYSQEVVLYVLRMLDRTMFGKEEETIGWLRAFAETTRYAELREYAESLITAAEMTMKSLKEEQ